MKGSIAVEGSHRGSRRVPSLLPPSVSGSDVESRISGGEENPFNGGLDGVRRESGHGSRRILPLPSSPV